MSDFLPPLVTKLIADAGQFRAQLGEAVASTEAAGGKMGSFAAPLATGVAAAGAVVIGLGAGALAVGEKFQSAYNKIQTGTGATGAALKGLESSFKNVLAGTAGSFEQVEAAIEGITRRTGLTGAALDDFAKKEVTLGRITKTDVAENVEATTAVMAKFGVAAKDQSRELDVLFKASQFSGKSVKDLSDDMANAEVSLHGVGLSFDQSAALVAAFGKAGINTTGAFTGLRKEFVNLAKDGKDPIAGFAELATKIRDAKTDTEAFGEAAKAFGPKGIEMAKAIRDGHLNVDDLVRSLTSGKGGIMDTASNVSTLGGKFALLKNKAMVAIEPIGMALVDLANNALGWVIEQVDELRPAFDDLADGVRTAFGIAKVAVDAFMGGFENPSAINSAKGIGGAFIDLGAAASDAMDWIEQAFGDAMSWLNANSATFEQWGSKIAEIFTQVAGVVSAEWDAIFAIFSWGVNIVGQLWDRFGEHLWGHIQTAFNNIIAIVQGVLEILKGIFDVFAGIFTGDWDRVWNGITEIFGGAWNTIVGIVSQGINAISTMIGIAMAVITEIWSGAWHFVESLVGGAWDEIIGTVSGAVDDVLGIFGSLPGQIADIASGMWDGIAGAFRAVINQVIDIWNGLHFTLPSVDFLGVHVGGGTIGVPHIGHLHTGGIVPGAPGQDVLAVLQAGEGVFSARQTRELDALLGGGGGGGTGVVVNVRVSGSVVTEGQLAKAIAEPVRAELLRLERRVGAGKLFG